MKKESQDVSSIAAAYLQELKGGGMVGHRVIHHDDKCKVPTAVYMEDTRAFVARIEREQKAEQKRYETSEVPVQFVLKAGHKYFYTFKGHEILWTYDINLAHTEHEYTVDGMVCLLEAYGADVTKFPAPEKA